MTDENREAILRVLDDEDCWTHVTHHYVTKMRDWSYTKHKKDGTPDIRQNVARIMKKLADVLEINVNISSEQTIIEEDK